MDPMADLRAAALALVVAVRVRAGTLRELWTKVVKPDAILMIVLKGCYLRVHFLNVLPIAGQAVKAKPV